ncbi:hypothetical protein GCM10010177_29260 [Actinomadura citrea]|nr:hypothetical protein GCM10010177_29260 [Actinomadura citrea]
MAISETRPWVGSTGAIHGFVHCSKLAWGRKVKPDSSADRSGAGREIPVDSNKAGGLVVAVEKIVAARGRATQPSDGGSTGKSDLNDG